MGETTFKESLLEMVREEQYNISEIERMFGSDGRDNESYTMAREFTKLCCIEALVETLT